MPSEILAVGSTAASSADVVIAEGETATVGIKGFTASSAEVHIELKDDDAGYNYLGSLRPTIPAVSITSPGTYRFTRRAGAACGVYSA